MTRPRRASVARWLQDAPPYVLDCFDHGPRVAGDRYTVMFQAERAAADRLRPGPTWWVPGLDLNPYGASCWFEAEQHHATGYRASLSRRRVRWLDLPEPVRAAVVARYTAE